MEQPDPMLATGGVPASCGAASISKNYSLVARDRQRWFTSDIARRRFSNVPICVTDGISATTM